MVSTCAFRSQARRCRTARCSTWSQHGSSRRSATPRRGAQHPAKRPESRDLFRGPPSQICRANAPHSCATTIRTTFVRRAASAAAHEGTRAPAARDRRHMSVDRRPSSDLPVRRPSVVALRWCAPQPIARPVRVPHSERGVVLFGEVQCLGTAFIASASPARRADFSAGVTAPTFATSTSSGHSSAP